jgi:hypothetical protein
MESHMPDIATLFARDPLTLTQPDITEIVNEMRKSRGAFNAGNMKAGSTKPKTAKQKEISGLASGLSINL